MAFDYSFVLPPTGQAENAQVREMFEDVKAYVNTLISGGGSGAPDNAQYVTLTANGNLSDERVLTAGTGISLTDNGAGSTVVVANTGVTSITVSDPYGNLSRSPSTGAVTLSMVATPTYSSIILQSSTGAIGITPSASVFTSYNLTLPLNTGTSGFILSTNGATPTATLSWVDPGTNFVTSVHGTADQINVTGTTGSVTFSTPQDIATSSSPTFSKLHLGGGTSSSDPALSIGDSNTGFFEDSGGDGFISLVLDGTIGTQWIPSTSTLWNTGPLQAPSLKLRNGSGQIVTISPNGSFTSYSLTMPIDDGSANQYLTTDGSGTLSWTNAAGTGTVNTGTAKTLAYYLSSTNAVQSLGVITNGRALVSDVDGLPTHSVTTTSELAFLSGTTSAVQTQLNGKQATLTTNSLTATSPISLSAAVTVIGAGAAVSIASAASGVAGAVSTTTQTFTGIKTFETQLIGKGTATNDSAAAGYIGEVISATGTANTNFPSSGSYGDYTSITLTAGDWDIWAVTDNNANGATVTFTVIGILATSGDNPPSTGFGRNDALPPTAVTDTTTFCGPLRVQLTGSTTYYLKYRANYTVATPQVRTGTIFARRVR